VYVPGAAGTLKHSGAMAELIGAARAHCGSDAGDTMYGPVQ